MLAAYRRSPVHYRYSLLDGYSNWPVRSTVTHSRALPRPIASALDGRSALGSFSGKARPRAAGLFGPTAAIGLKQDEGTLVSQLVHWVNHRIEERVFRGGGRLPSIRRLAQDRGISRFTVVQAYERLVAMGALESRRGSGFYVREQTRLPPESVRAPSPTSGMDVAWLLRNMFRQLPPQSMPGGGLPPADWLDADLVAARLRAVARQSGTHHLAYGLPQGFLPLRNQLQLKLAEREIAANPQQIVLTAGATQAFDLIARHFIRPGDTVLVDDPAWFLMFGMFAAYGARVIGVPRGVDGPDLEVLERIAMTHKPRFYVVHSILHNPTSFSLSPAKAYRILQLADAYDFAVIEDDVYGDLHPGGSQGRNLPAIRLASLDQLRRVVYVGSFSKTLAANLRVGFLACAPGLAQPLSDLKMLNALTTPEIGERVVYRVLSEGHYRKHVERLRSRLDAVREHTVRNLERVGLSIPNVPAAGMFLWARGSSPSGPLDTNRVAARMMERGYLLAPGSLFSPAQLPSAWMRFNIATSNDPDMLAALARTLEEAG